MTVTSGFFNSVNHDRLYTAEQISSIFDGIILDGVYQGIGDAFEVVPYSDANDTVIVKTGRAWFDHTWILNDSDFSITLDSPNPALGRIDAIVIDVDRRQTVRKNSILYIPGEYSSAPTYPKLIKSEFRNQYPLCYITVAAGESSPVSALNIENKVGTSDCPIVTGVLEVMSSDRFVQQMNEKFNDWFEGIKDLMDSNTALKLQNQIDALNSSQSAQDTKIERLNSKVFNFSDGRNLGSIITEDQHSKIASGDFSDFIAGDYWEIGGVKYYIVGFDSFYNIGNSDGSDKVMEHHLVLSPGEFIQSDQINETFGVSNYYNIDGDDMDWGLLYTFNQNIYDNFVKAYSVPLSKYIRVSSASESKILNAFGADNVLSIPQAIPTDSQNFEVSWSKVIIPYDFQIGIKNYGTGYYSLISGADRIQWTNSNDNDFHLFGSSLAVPVGNSLSQANDMLGLSMVYPGNFSYSTAVYNEKSVQYYPTYLANSLFSPYYKNLIDDLANGFYTKILTGFNNTTSVRSSVFSSFGLGNFYAHGNYDLMGSYYNWSTNPGSSPWIFSISNDCYDYIKTVFSGGSDAEGTTSVNIGGIMEAKASGHILSTNFPSIGSMSGDTSWAVDQRAVTFPNTEDNNMDFLYMRPECIMAGGYTILSTNKYLGDEPYGTESSRFNDDLDLLFDSYEPESLSNHGKNYKDGMRIYHDGGGFSITKESSDNTTLRSKGSWIFNASDYSTIYDALCPEFKNISKSFDHIRVTRNATNSIALFAIK